jgi:DNA/RNA-binding domain of Phe-tRNA-synthetase-like protein
MVAKRLIHQTTSSDDNPMIELALAAELTNVQVVSLEIAHVAVMPASVKLRLWADEIAAAAIEKAKSVEAEKLRAAVRKMLRHGKFKASGRSKPAHEYLLRCAQEEGSLPRINGPVDVLNSCSLISGLPISLLSLAKCSRKLLVRRGTAGEGFVFNSSGQLLDVEDLIVTCDASQSPARPVGSPIKDSMVGKIEAQDTELIAVVYAPAEAEGIHAALTTINLLAESMVTYCDATLA